MRKIVNQFCFLVLTTACITSCSEMFPGDNVDNAGTAVRNPTMTDTRLGQQYIPRESREQDVTSDVNNGTGKTVSYGTEAVTPDLINSFTPHKSHAKKKPDVAVDDQNG